MLIGERLQQERQRLGLTQAEFAEACGSGKRQQSRYEAGEQVPGGEYLAGAAQLGVDVAYVLTGSASVSTGNVSAEDALLLAAYHRAPPATRSLVLAALGAGTPAPASSTAGIKISGGKQNQVIQGNVRQDDAVFNVGGRKKK